MSLSIEGNLTQHNLQISFDEEQIEEGELLIKNKKFSREKAQHLILQVVTTIYAALTTVALLIDKGIMNQN